MKLTQEQIARVNSLETARGEITPRAVVEDARAKSSPLHALFEWNNGKAADAYRLAQAREVIGSVTIEVVTRETTIHTPHYVRDTEANGQGYRSVTAIKSEPERARETLVYTLEIAAGHVRRALDLSVALGMTTEIDALLAQIIGVQRLIESKAA